MKKTFILYFIVSLFQSIYAQDFLSNNHALVSIKDGALLSVQGSVFIENNGVFDNSDTIKITEDFINNSGDIGFNQINKGFVYLIGSDQRIKGTDETYFHNLLLKNVGIKYGDLDVFVDGFLDLDSLEFNLDTNVVFVTNTEIDAVRNNNEGFVSSLKNGGLSRATNLEENYIFSVGSSIYGKIYRPVGLKTTNNLQSYRVRFADEDASNDDLDRENRAVLICEINDAFYHKIWQETGVDSADLKFYFHASEDGNQFNEIVHWNNEPKWEKTPADTLINGVNWDILEVNNWNDYETENFAMAFGKEHFADAGADQSIYLLDTIQLNASGGTDYLWTPENSVSCSDCADPLYWDDSTRTMVLKVIDEDNCTDFDTLNITVNERFTDEGPFIPDGITPNGDGVNDAWYIRWLYRYPDNELVIVNRWEDVVYKSAPYNQDWYGTYNGKDLPEGTYYYILKINENGVLKDTYTGPITIIK